MNRRQFAVLLVGIGAVGLAVVAVGVGLIYPPAGLIVGGAPLVLVGLAGLLLVNVEARR